MMTVVFGGASEQAPFGTPAGNLSPLAISFDGNTSQSYTVCSTISPSVSGYNNFVGLQYPSGVQHIVGRFVIYSPNDDGFRGDGATIGAKLQGSNDGSTWVDLWTGTLPSGGSYDVSSGITITTAYNMHRIAMNGNGTNAIRVAELILYKYSLTSISGR